MTVSYVLSGPGYRVLPWSVTFRTDPPGTVVPPMVLVAHPRTVPLSVDDGQIVARFPAGRDGTLFPIRTSVSFALRLACFPDPNVEPDSVADSPSPPRDRRNAGLNRASEGSSTQNSIIKQSTAGRFVAISSFMQKGYTMINQC